MPTNAVPQYNAMLPPTSCTSDMRERILAIVKQRGVSIADVQREAFALFLSENYSDAKADSRITENHGAS